MPNFRASSASLMRPPGLRRPDVISFSKKLRTCSDRLSVSKNEMTPSHAEILGGLKRALPAIIADCGQKITRVKRLAIEKRRPPRSRISAKCAASVIARRSSRSLDCIIFPVPTGDPAKQTSCHSNHQSRIWPRHQAVAQASWKSAAFGWMVLGTICCLAELLSRAETLMRARPALLHLTYARPAGRASRRFRREPRGCLSPLYSVGR